MKNKNIFKIFKLLALTIFISALAFSQALAEVDVNAAKSTQNFKETANNLTNNVLTSLGMLLMAAAFVVFFYGVVVFMYDRATGKNDAQSLEKGKNFMIWGLAGLFVMVSVWGIIKLVQGMLDIKGNEIKIEPIQFAQMSQTAESKTNTTNDNGLTPNTDNTNVPGFKDGDVVMQAADGTQKVNPWANTSLYPVLEVGSTDSANNQRLNKLLISKNCLNDEFNYTAAASVFSTHASGNLYNTEDAVKNFQTRNGLVADGKVGVKTWEALYVSTGQTTVFTGITVKNCSY